jgi:hypothetical protein
MSSLLSLVMEDELLMLKRIEHDSDYTMNAMQISSSSISSGPDHLTFGLCYQAAICRARRAAFSDLLLGYKSWF